MTKLVLTWSIMTKLGSILPKLGYIMTNLGPIGSIMTNLGENASGPPIWSRWYLLRIQRRDTRHQSDHILDAADLVSTDRFFRAPIGIASSYPITGEEDPTYSASNNRVWGEGEGGGGAFAKANSPPSRVYFTVFCVLQLRSLLINGDVLLAEGAEN